MKKHRQKRQNKGKKEWREGKFMIENKEGSTGVKNANIFRDLTSCPTKHIYVQSIH